MNKTIFRIDIVVGILNAIAACACFVVAGESYVLGEIDLVNILLGSINFLCAVYNICHAVNMYLNSSLEPPL